jgi:thioredoxin-like negative regulator of GroEL
MIQEYSEKDLLIYMGQRNEAFALFLYTPLCGTCKLAERMLDIILLTEPSLTIIKSNINFTPQLTRNWQIASVPCIVLIKDGEGEQFIYNMKSVDELYKKLSTCLRC